MSSASAGKFQDHYEILGVDPRAPNETIHEAYSRLAKRCRELGESERLEAVSLAYEVLSDQMLRREFDKLKGIGEDTGGPKFSGNRFFETFGRDTHLRMTLLCLLYDRRRNKPFTPSLSVRHIENMLAATSEEIVIALWYLKARNLAANDDKSSVLITVDGIDYLEQRKPDRAAVLLLIKPESIAGAPPAPAALVPAPEPAVIESELEPVAVMAGAGGDPTSSLSILRRVLQRN